MRWATPDFQISDDSIVASGNLNLIRLHLSLAKALQERPCFPFLMVGDFFGQNRTELIVPTTVDFEVSNGGN